MSAELSTFLKIPSEQNQYIKTAASVSAINKRRLCVEPVHFMMHKVYMTNVSRDCNWGRLTRHSGYLLGKSPWGIKKKCLLSRAQSVCMCVCVRVCALTFLSNSGLCVVKGDSITNCWYVCMCVCVCAHFLTGFKLGLPGHAVCLDWVCA